MPVQWWVAAGGLLLTAVSFGLGVSFRAGVIWEGIREYQERVKNLERRYRELRQRIHDLKMDLHGVKLRDVEGSEFEEVEGRHGDTAETTAEKFDTDE